MFALPIFTARHQATIVGVSELNFCVRDGNRWTLTTINTNFLGYAPSKLNIKSFILHFSATLSLRFGQAFGLLVSVSSIHYCTSTSDLSTSSSTTSLSGDIILGRVSRLDAFSVYLVRT